MKFIRKIKKLSWKIFGIEKVLDRQLQLIYAAERQIKTNNEILKAHIFNNTIADSSWLKYKSFTPGAFAVDYGFLTTLYQTLNIVRPATILEFGLGQSSKMVHQYATFCNAEATTCEHDVNWASFFNNGRVGQYDIKIDFLELEHVDYNGKKTLSYKNIDQHYKEKKYDLIIVDGPFGSAHYSRSQIINLAKNNLKESFCIIIDDYERIGEQETAKELLNVLDEKKITYRTAVYSASKQHFLVCTEDLSFLTTLH